MSEIVNELKDKWDKFWKAAIIIIGIMAAIATAMASITWGSIAPEGAVPRAANVPCYTEQGGAKTILGSGCELEAQSGSTVDFQAGSTISNGAGWEQNNNLVIVAPTAIGTATPALLVNSLGVSHLFEVQDGGASVFAIENGGNFTTTNGGIIAAPTAQATGVPALAIDNAGVSNILEVRDGGSAVFSVEDGGNFVTTNGGVVAAPTAQATAVPAFEVDSAGVSKILEVNDAASPVFSIINGGGVVQPLEIEHLGTGETHVTLIITFTAAAGGSGTVATIGANETWLVRRVLISVTTNFDATGDDVTLDIGDDLDVDGFLNLADADLQAAATDYTGAQPGWQGLDGATPTGIYIIGGPHIYETDGTPQTIDWLLDETSGETISAGELTLHLFYTRFR